MIATVGARGQHTVTDGIIIAQYVLPCRSRSYRLWFSVEVRLVVWPRRRAWCVRSGEVHFDDDGVHTLITAGRRPVLHAQDHKHASFVNHCSATARILLFFGMYRRGSMSRWMLSKWDVLTSFEYKGKLSQCRVGKNSIHHSYFNRSGCCLNSIHRPKRICTFAFQNKINCMEPSLKII